MTEPYPGTIENPASQGDRRGAGFAEAGMPAVLRLLMRHSTPLCGARS